MNSSSTSQTASPEAQSIFAVVVLYKMLPAQSPSLTTLLAAADALPKGALGLQILVVDNTPGGQAPGPLPEGIIYKAAPHNPGLAEPYNLALEMASIEGYQWLLTLDQDTTLPSTFLVDMAQAARQYEPSPEVAAVVPRIVDGGRPISPFRFVGGFLPSVLPATVSGISARHTSALNSASLLRVAALRALGGYDVRFPLHNSDTRLYQRLDSAGNKVAVAGNVIVPHEFSILDRQNRMSTARYRHMLEDECYFWDRHMNFPGRIERIIRLAGRFCKGVLRGEDAAFSNVTKAEIRRRLTTSRKERIRARDASAGRSALT